MPVGSALHGCPRALLTALLASAVETDDAVSALGIEREILTLCRERQEVVNGIVTLEGELADLFAESHAGRAGAEETWAKGPASEAPLVKESAPVRVVSRLTSPTAADEAPAAEAEPAAPSYAWFSIIGTAGDLRAGISDGTGGGARVGGARVWFVREGDRLPGGVTIERIDARPPGVHAGGVTGAALPYRPRPHAAIASNAMGDGP